MKIKLYIKSYYNYYVNEFIQKIEKHISKNLNYNKVQLFLPSKLEKFTLLRSPHADKKARDQFERKTYKRVLVLDIPNLTQKDILQLNILFTILKGFAVGIEFRLCYTLKE